MTEHNVFTKKHTEEVTQAKQTLLDELNLPPHVTTFLRENKHVLFAVFILVILTICGRSYYIHYTTSVIDRSSGALAQALIVEDSENRLEALKTVIVDQSDTGAANWATMALAHEYIDNKLYDEAISVLGAQLDTLKSDDPQLVLCKILLAHSYEENKQNELALTLYKEIRDVHEYMVIGNINVARVFEKMGQKDGAIDAYEKAVSSPALAQPEVDWLKDRIRYLSQS